MRIALIGASRVAEHHYLPALAGSGDIGILSGDRDRAAALMGRIGGQVLTDLPSFSPDVVFVVNREEHHAEALDAALSAGIPRLFCEKPLVARNGQDRIDDEDWASAVAMAERVGDSDSEVAIGFNYRTFHAFRRGVETAQQRGWGALVSVSVQTHYACLSHVLDLMMVLGGPVTEAFAYEGVWHPSAGSWLAPDRHVVARLESGPTADLHVTSARAWEDDLFRLTAQYEGGRFTMVDLDRSLQIFDDQKGRIIETAGSREEGYARSFRTSIQEYLDAVAAGRPAPTGIDAALRHLHAEAMIVRSVRLGRPVTAGDLTAG
jgi:predicted dehydrogenase